MTVSISYRVVGPGRAGRSLIDALAGSSWTCVGTYGRGDDPSDAASGVDVLVITVPDDAIAAVARAVRPGRAVVMHLSGAKTLDVLEPHERRASVHPLLSLPDPETGSSRLRDNAAFAVAGDPMAGQLVDALGGRAFRVAEADRALYHGAAAIAANHLVALCAQVERIADHIGVPAELYWELMATTLANVARVGPQAALTGPASRGDRRTLAAHAEALAELDEREVELYWALADEAARLGGHQARPAGPTTEDRTSIRSRDDRKN